MKLSGWYKVIVFIFLLIPLLNACGDTPTATTVPPTPTVPPTATPTTVATTTAATTTTAQTTPTVSSSVKPTPVVIDTATATPTSTPLPADKLLAEYGTVRITFTDYLHYRQFYAFRDLFFYQVFVANDFLSTQDVEQLKILQKNLDILPYLPVDRRKLQEYLQSMILVQEAKKDFGITATPDDIELEISNQIGPVVGISTFDTAATATAGAVFTPAVNIDLATIAAITPFPGTPLPPTPTLAASPTPISSPAAFSAKRKQNFFDNLQKATGLTRDDYARFEAEPNVVARKLDSKLRERLPKIGDPVAQLRFSQIVSKDEASAKAIQQELQGANPADLNNVFTKLAREKSLEKYSAVRNGDVGWIIEPMVEQGIFLAIKDLRVGEFTKPVETGSGWVVALLTGKEDKRPLDAIQYEFLAGLSYGRSLLYDQWIRSKISSAGVKFFV